MSLEKTPEELVKELERIKLRNKEILAKLNKLPNPPSKGAA